jgi:hypothetical protein
MVNIFSIAFYFLSMAKDTILFCLPDMGVGSGVS